MVLRVARNVLAFAVILAPVAPSAIAGDGTFGIPSSGILMPPPPKVAAPKAIPPRQTAALVPAERADIERQRPVIRTQQTYSPAPADGAGRSRVVPPSEAPIHSPIVVPPKKKQFKAPMATVDPSYVERLAGDPGAETQAAPVAAPVAAPASPPVMAQGAAPEARRGLFGMLKSRSAAAAAYDEHVAAPQVVSAPVQQQAPARGASRFSFGGANPSARASDGTPCGQLRGIFTSPPECR